MTFLRHAKYVPLVIRDGLCGLHTKVKGFNSTGVIQILSLIPEEACIGMNRELYIRSHLAVKMLYQLTVLL